MDFFNSFTVNGLFRTFLLPFIFIFSSLSFIAYYKDSRSNFPIVYRWYLYYVLAYVLAYVLLLNFSKYPRICY